MEGAKNEGDCGKGVPTSRGRKKVMLDLVNRKDTCNDSKTICALDGRCSRVGFRTLPDQVSSSVYLLHIHAMSNATETSSTNAPTKEETQPTLGVLEEDDEFEEFGAQGLYMRNLICFSFLKIA